MKKNTPVIYILFVFTMCILILSCNQNTVEICNDGIDNDWDSFIDCDDFSCDNDSFCMVEICDDGKDNDNDGFIDGDDWDCDESKNCNDGIDNDNDGYIDCDDYDCDSDVHCTS